MSRTPTLKIESKYYRDPQQRRSDCFQEHRNCHELYAWIQIRHKLQILLGSTRKDAFQECSPCHHRPWLCEQSNSNSAHTNKPAVNFFCASVTNVSFCDDGILWAEQHCVSRANWISAHTNKSAVIIFVPVWQRYVVVTMVLC